jgi:hypothetical protein
MSLALRPAVTPPPGANLSQKSRARAKYFWRRNQDSCREFLKNYPHVALSEGLRQTLKNVVEIFKLVLTFR